MSAQLPSIATMSTKGQVTVPRRFRHALGWRAGDHLLVEPRGKGCFALPKVSPTLGRALRDYGRGRRTLTDDEVLLLAMLADPTTTEATLSAQIQKIRQRRGSGEREAGR
jgi:bifunctional DNA-binding transcriptional regulator/antitoxin component of YhaV-PrlF toxin-antitoxin module